MRDTQQNICDDSHWIRTPLRTRFFFFAHLLPFIFIVVWGRANKKNCPWEVYVNSYVMSKKLCWKSIKHYLVCTFCDVKNLTRAPKGICRYINLLADMKFGNILKHLSPDCYVISRAYWNRALARTQSFQVLVPWGQYLKMTRTRESMAESR